MIDITPATDSNTEVNEGDKVRVSWLLDASVDPSDRTLTETTFGDEVREWSGDDLSEEEVTKGDERYWRYYKDLVLPSARVTYEWELDDPVNDAHDTAKITAQI